MQVGDTVGKCRVQVTGASYVPSTLDSYRNFIKTIGTVTK